jgi:hypothetical protein
MAQYWSRFSTTAAGLSDTGSGTATAAVNGRIKVKAWRSFMFVVSWDLGSRKGLMITCCSVIARELSADRRGGTVGWADLTSFL